MRNLHHSPFLRQTAQWRRFRFRYDRKVLADLVVLFDLRQRLDADQGLGNGLCRAAGFRDQQEIGTQ